MTISYKYDMLCLLINEKFTQAAPVRGETITNVYKKLYDIIGEAIRTRKMVCRYQMYLNTRSKLTAIG